MANYYTQFSARLPMRSPEAAIAALALLDRQRDLACTHDSGGDAVAFCHFMATIDDDPLLNRDVLWIRSDDGGDPDSVLSFVETCAKANLTPTGRWSFMWSFGCNRPRLDGFGGGACVIDLATGALVAVIDLNAWTSNIVADQHVCLTLSPHEAACAHDILCRANPNDPEDDDAPVNIVIGALERVARRQIVTLRAAGPE
ncbi:hypothetical protein HLH33_13710 [Gluconacetobacter diazotrophicus]|uniref:Uncharacterized protein n=1 Tax=Gluconacetobacter diazotrophicus TaxID=33996 RepID=A0A7W4I6V1_GLUDI|nr:hypothetical protein [Gluconacetobacter diazotrophicus]MBB2157355.1 hypothetical protein [Gluconacetobacter diazotrophicus]